MLKTVFSVMFMAILAVGRAQQGYFVLIQSENNHAFTAKINEQTFTSSDHGRVVLPQLKDSTYPLTIGFPENHFPEQHFVITINKKEQGLQLKFTDDKGWMLINTQTGEIKEAIKTQAVSQTISAGGIRKEDPFSRLMAGVVNDTAFLYSTYADVPEKQMEKSPAGKKPLVKTDSLQSPPIIAAKKPVADSLKKEVAVNKPAEKKNDTAAVVNTLPTEKKRDSMMVASNPPAEKKKDSMIVANNASAEKRKDSAVVMNNLPPIKRKEPAVIRNSHTGVQKLSEQKTEDALVLTYAQHMKDGITDTVNVIIPFEKDVVKKVQQPVVKKEENAPVKDTAAHGKPEIEKNSAKPTLAARADSGGRKQPVSTEGPGSRVSVINSNCRNLANDYDVDKLRVKMIAAENEDDKMLVAKKFFRVKCYSTQQIRALSEIFSTDEGRYKLFDTAYPFISDYGNFPQLADLLTSQYYINRFRAMLKP